MYRAAPAKLSRAVDYFVKRFDEGALISVLSLGDAIDGNVDQQTTLADLERVATQFDRLRLENIPAHHARRPRKHT